MNVITAASEFEPLNIGQYCYWLRSLLHSYFGIEDIKTLCFDLGMEFDDLPGETLTSKTRELVNYCIRYKRLEDLIDLCIQTRPHLTTNLTSIHQAYQQAPDQFILKPFNDPEAKSLNNGVSALLKLIQQPIEKDRVTFSLENLKHARNQIGQVLFYKQVHDQLQEIETIQQLLIKNHNDLLENELGWLSLVKSSAELLTYEINVLRTQVANRRTESATWMRMLLKGESQLRTAITEQSIQGINVALGEIHRAITVGTPRVNDLLVESATALPLDELVKVLNTVANLVHKKVQPNIEIREQLSSSINALITLAENLDQMVVSHNAWQALDDELRRIEANLSIDITELRQSWPDIARLSRQLYRDSQETWANTLANQVTYIESALFSQGEYIVISMFTTYRSQTGRKFRQVDDSLRKLCEHLEIIADLLDALL